MKRTSLTPRMILAVTPLTLAMVAGVASAAQPSHRPLADADGYPLVGNLIRKGETKPAPTPTPTPTPTPAPTPPPPPKPKPHTR